MPLPRTVYRSPAKPPLVYNTDSGSMTLSAVLWGNYDLIKTGDNQLTLSGSNTFTGGLEVRRGILKIASSNALGGLGNVVTVSAGAVLDVNAQTTTRNVKLALSGDGFGGVGCLTNSSASGAVLVNDAAYLGNITVGGIGQIQINGNVSGVGNITKVDSNTFIFGGSQSYTGNVYILNGSVITRNSANIIGTIYLGENGSSNNASFSSGVNQTYSNPLVVVAGATGVLGTLTYGGASSPTFSGGITGTNDFTVTGGTTVTFSTGAIDLVGTFINTGATTVNVSSVVTANCTGLTQNRASSTLNISGTNTNYAGTTSILQGTLGVNNNTALGSGPLVIGSGVTLSVNGTRSSTSPNTQTWNGSWTFTSSGFSWSMSNGAVSITAPVTVTSTATSGSTLTVSGSITGAYDITTRCNANGAITLSLPNNTGTITNSGTSTGNVLYATVGANVTGITQNAASSTLRITSAACPVTVTTGVLMGAIATGSSATSSGTLSIANAATAVIRPGSFGNNTFNCGAVTFGGTSSRAQFDSTTTTFSKLNVTGAVALAGMGCIFPAGITTNGTYDLIVASGTMSGTLPSIITNSTGKTLVLSQVGNTLKVTVS